MGPQGGAMVPQGPWMPLVGGERKRNHLLVLVSANAIFSHRSAGWRFGMSACRSPWLQTFTRAARLPARPAHLPECSGIPKIACFCCCFFSIFGFVASRHWDQVADGGLSFGKFYITRSWEED